MTPYFERAGITIYHGDCRDVLPTLEVVDHVITDPPYAPRAMKNARSANTIKQRRDGVIYDFGYAALTDDLRTLICAEAARLARRWVLCWTDIESDQAWRDGLVGAGLRYVRTGVWVREHGAPQFSGDRPAQGVEACVIGHHAGERMRWNGGGKPATWIGPIVNSQDPSRCHASPKPLWLMRELIAAFTDPGDLILDPFLGSGTTARAALDLGRRCIGVELSERDCESAAQRMSQQAMAL